MGEKYWASGVQLGMLIAGNEKERERLVNRIIDKQFIGNYRTEKEQKAFKQQIKKIK